MNYLINREDIKPGAIIKSYVNGRFEGWIRLIELCGEPFSYIDKSRVLVKERWRVRFVSLDEVPETLTDSQRISQELFREFMTHRFIHYFGARTWEEYAAKYGYLQTTNIDDRDKFISDKNDLF